MSLEKLKSLFLPNLAGKSFLDVGCNEGFFCGYAKFNGASRVVGIDLNEAFIRRAEARFPDCEFLHQSWASLPNGQFDVIVMLSAIHYAEDQPAMIAQLVEKLAPDGILVLEMGVINSDQPEWVTVERSIDTRLFPTNALLPELLKPYAWKWIAHSVSQTGDPTPRSVIHISKRKPVAYLLMEPPGSGKGSIARDVFMPAGLKILHSDVFIASIANGTTDAPPSLREVIAQNAPFLELDLSYYRIFGSGLGSVFLDAILKGSEQQDFVFDGFVPAEYKQAVISHLEGLGYMPVLLSWHRPQANLLSKKAVNTSAASYENFLEKIPDKQTRPIVDGLTPPQGCLDLINFNATGIVMLPESFYQLPPGIYAIRRSGLSAEPLQLTQLPSQRGELAQLQSLSSHGSMLQTTSDCVVIQVSGGTANMAASYVDGRGLAPPHGLSVIRLDQTASQPIQPTFLVPANGLSMIGHIHESGDRLALPGSVLGDPGSMHSISGLQLIWPDKPEGIELHYRLDLERYEPGVWADCGNFCGVREREVRATAFELALTGIHSTDYRIEGLAFFSGGFQIPLTVGRNQGPSGLEHLAALQLEIKPRDLHR